MIDYILKAVQTLFFTGFTFFFYYLTKGTREMYEKNARVYKDPNAKIIMGTVVGIGGNKNGSIYYISFEDNGKYFERAKTIRYKITHSRHTRKGEVVPIKYYLSSAGAPKVMIMDDELVPCGNGSKLEERIFLGVSAGCLAFTIYFLIRACLVWMS